jgi:uncharacterized protein DUF1579
LRIILVVLPLQRSRRMLYGRLSVPDGAFIRRNRVRSWHATLVHRIIEVTTPNHHKERQRIMKYCIRYTCSALVVAGTLAASFALAEGKSASEKSDPKMEEMMKKAEAAGTPGAAHKALEPLVGDWTAEVKSWMAPDAPPTVTKATAKSSWAMNGRFVQEEFKGEMMGKPFHGMSLTGYDNQKQKYNSLWVDDMSTAIFTSEGTADDGAKVITFTGKMDCPMTGQKDMPVKHVVRIISPDKHVFEMHDPSKGDNSKTMEITYTRK